MEECPCEKCIHYEFMKRHPNPNAVDDHWCNLRNKAIYLTSHDHVFHPDTWIVPCGGRMFRDRDDVPDMTGVIGYSRKDGYIYETEEPMQTDDTIVLKCLDGEMNFAMQAYRESEAVRDFIDNRKDWIAGHTIREVADELEGVYTGG